jgi:FixJ family two-component response regulator
MPKMDGVEVLEAVEKSNQKFPWWILPGHGDM